MCRQSPSSGDEARWTEPPAATASVASPFSSGLSRGSASLPSRPAAPEAGRFCDKWGAHRYNKVLGLKMRAENLRKTKKKNARADSTQMGSGPPL